MSDTKAAHPYRNAVSMESNSGTDGSPLMRITWESWHETKESQVEQLQKLYWGIKGFMEQSEMERAEAGTGINVAKGRK